MKDRERIAEPFKRENKYLVLKWDDLEKYLSSDPFLKFDFVGYLCDTVKHGRHKDGKRDNSYVVVNEDEPYAEDVWMLIEEGKSLRELGYTRPSTTLRTSHPDDGPDCAGARHQTLKNEPEPVDGADPNKEISDGFGSFWSATCPMCGKKSMSVVRPGKVQCSNCD